ncbi:synaptotagmin family C2 domain-containing protein [Schizosaccharomyces japonicus yFS275]|uniref:Synaptotagmin family C2 domain-containing protein n=1 Tax=Schizosaccharomyces japonicus (strain yFS275 / FY16936) TaxID=402676 RepID=B6JXX5_SCHJY|nr:synaptotagmin family C2 domain-containing protein [Schizosaccharomyces japonicus yFS275]EEB06393.1 synaptotagmin family C2 domain-containing protein [Schizosaccharomyces japonicus yFS275]
MEKKSGQVKQPAQASTEVDTKTVTGELGNNLDVKLETTKNNVNGAKNGQVLSAKVEEKKNSTGVKQSTDDKLPVPESLEAPVSEPSRSDEKQASSNTSSDSLNEKKEEEEVKDEQKNVSRIVTLLGKFLTKERVYMLLEWKNIFVQYSNDTRIIFYTALSSFFIGYFRFGILGLFVVMAVCIQYYRIQVRKVVVNFRDDFTRYLATRRIEDEPETVAWLNSFLQKFWYIFEPSLSANVVETADQVLSENTPGFLDSLRLSKFTLGTKSPRLDFIRSYPKTEEDLYMMDLACSFTPDNLSELTGHEIATQIKPKIELSVRIGKSIASASMPVLVEDFSFSGVIRLKLKFLSSYPYIKSVGLTFVEKPDISFVLKPIGGEKLGFDIGNVPGLSKFIYDQIHLTLGPMMYSPNVYELDIEQMMGAANMNVTIGAISFHLQNATGLKPNETLSGTPDPYVVIRSTLTGRELARSKTVSDTSSPTFDEKFEFTITSFSEQLVLEVYDYNDIRSDKLIGTNVIETSVLDGAPVVNDATIDVKFHQKIRGSLKYSIRFYPVIEVTEGENASDLTGPGILRYTVFQAKELSTGSNRYTAYAELVMNGKIVHTTRKIKKNNNPSWGDFQEYLVKQKSKCSLGVRIRADGVSKPLGVFNITLDDLLTATKKGLNWFQLENAKSGRVRIAAEWKPVDMTAVCESADIYREPLGALRLFIRNANSLSPKSHGGKVNASTRVLCHNKEMAQTVTIANHTQPVWDEYLYVPIVTKYDIIRLQVLSHEGEERILGYVDISPKDYIRQDASGKLIPFEQTREVTTSLTSVKGLQTKSSLCYLFCFYPNPAKFIPTPKNVSRTASIATSQNESPSATPQPKKEVVSPLLSSPSDLEEDLKQLTGFLCFDIIKSNLPNPGSQIALQVDDIPEPVFISPKTKHGSASAHLFGEYFVRELPYSRLTFLVTDPRSSKKILGSVSIPATTFLQRSGLAPLTIKFKEVAASFTVCSCLVPIPVIIDRTESFLNMGKLTVDVIEGIELPKMDRSGKSDPFVVFELQGEEVYKTKTIKKTLNPQFNESFTVEIPNRHRNRLIAKCYDWDFGGKNDFMGNVVIDMASLSPNEKVVLTLPLDGELGGELKLGLQFTPAWILRSKRGGSRSVASSVFGHATDLAGMPIKGLASLGGGVVDGIGAVGHVTNKLRKGVLGGFRHKRDEE